MRTDVQIAEQERLAALDRYDILDTPAEETFDRITRLTRRIFDVPMSTITLIDGHRQWFKSRQGVTASETAKPPSLCDYAIREGRALIVPDTLLDWRFASNPFVVGEPHIRFYAGVPLRTPDGHNIGTLCAMDTRARTFPADQEEALTDLSRIVMSELELRVLSMTDGLTGMLARRAFRLELGRTFALALRHRHALGCIVLDLDHFQAVNEANGHFAGDLVIGAAAKACQEALRTSDAIGRLGGTQFAVLLPHTELASALRVAEKLRAAIAGLRVPFPLGHVRLTASFGVAALDGSMAAPDALLERAEAALRAAKAEGGDRCLDWRPVAIAQQSVQRRVLKAGRISFNGGRSTIDCTVRSLSDEGASMRVVSTAGIPERFKLLIEADNLSRLCQVSAKAEQLLDVAFV